MKKNEKVVMLIEAVDLGHVPFYELYDDVAYGHERYNEMWDAANICSVNFVYIMEHMLEDYYNLNYMPDLFGEDEEDWCNVQDLFHKRREIELAVLWEKLHK